MQLMQQKGILLKKRDRYTCVVHANIFFDQGKWLVISKCILWRGIKWSIDYNSIALIQDNLGKLHERSKETSKITKQLGRLFPNKVTIQVPQVWCSYTSYNLLPLATTF